MEHLTTLGLGWTNVNAIEVQEFDGDPPLCQVGGGDFDRLLATEKKLEKKVDPPARRDEKNRNISIYDRITTCVSSAQTFEKMYSCKGYIDLGFSPRKLTVFDGV